MGGGGVESSSQFTGGRAVTFVHKGYKLNLKRTTCMVSGETVFEGRKCVTDFLMYICLWFEIHLTCSLQNELQICNNCGTQAVYA